MQMFTFSNKTTLNWSIHQDIEENNKHGAATCAGNYTSCIAQQIEYARYSSNKQPI